MFKSLTKLLFFWASVVFIPTLSVLCKLTNEGTLYYKVTYSIITYHHQDQPKTQTLIEVLQEYWNGSIPGSI